MHTVTPLVGHHFVSALHVDLAELGDAPRRFVGRWQRRHVDLMVRARREIDGHAPRDLGPGPSASLARVRFRHPPASTPA